MVGKSMSIDALQTEVAVHEVMNSPVITLEKTTIIKSAAKLMRDLRIGSVVIVDSESQPVGIITQTDLVDRVLAEGKNPDSLTVEDIMSSPLVTGSPDESIQDAARRMSTANVDRLIVLRNGKLAGVLSTRDLLRVTPQIMDIMSEKARIERQEVEPIIGESIMGYCDSCGNWSDALVEVNGDFICPDCMVDFSST
jgi:CBS domain-containing protein